MPINYQFIAQFAFMIWKLGMVYDMFLNHDHKQFVFRYLFYRHERKFEKSNWRQTY